MPLPHPPTFNARELTLAVLVLPLAVATDSLLHTLTITGVAIVAHLSFAVIARFTRATSTVRDAALLVWAAALATMCDRLLHAYFYEAYRSMLFVAPVVLASLVTTHLWTDDSEHVVRPRGWLLALGTVIAIGIAREIVGHGSLLHDLDHSVSLTFFRPEMGFFLAALAPGAFIALGIALAIVNAWRHHRAQS